MAIGFFGIASSQTELSDRKTVAVMPTSGEIENEFIKRAIQDAIQEALVNSSLYAPVARGEDFGQIMKEYDFQAGGAVDDKQRIAFGHAYAANYVCDANVGMIGNNYIISYKMINVATSEIVAQKSRRTANGDKDLMDILDDIVRHLFEDRKSIIGSALTAIEIREKEAAGEWQKLKNTTDLTAIENFINKYRKTEAEAEAREKLSDEKFWLSTKREKTIRAYEQYHQLGLSTQYKEIAKTELENLYYLQIKTSANNKYISEMDDYYNRYIKMFPSGSKVSELKTLRCETYNNQAIALSSPQKSLSRDEKIDNLQTANKYFDFLQTNCPNFDKTNINTYLTSNNLKIREIKRGNGIYSGYTADTRTSFGVTVIRLKQNGFGWYLSYRTTGNYYKDRKRITADLYEYGELILRETNKQLPISSWETGGGDKKTGFANFNEYENSKLMNINFAIGLNKRIIYPLWGYLGVGWLDENQCRDFEFWKYETETWTGGGWTPYYGNLANYAYLKKSGLMLDAGVSARLSFLVFNVGILTSGFLKIYPTFGLQFGFKTKN